MSVPGPVLGPCSAWIGAGDVADCCSAASNPASYDDVALDASMVLFELSGRQFSGICEQKVRPVDTRCQHWHGYGFWSASSWGWDGLGWWDGFRHYGCGHVSYVKLAGYPVRQILEVKIDGAVVDPGEYRLDRWRELVRMDDPGPPVVHNHWPKCQNIALDDDQPGTFSITYEFGVDPPPLGIHAAAELACQLYLACQGADCELPRNATRVVRQGIEIDRTVLLNFLMRGQPTGMTTVDAFLSAYPSSGRRPAVFSPDVHPYPRRVTTE
jgi:hypothetical protein